MADPSTTPTQWIPLVQEDPVSRLLKEYSGATTLAETPRVDIQEGQDAYLVIVEVPGLSRDDLDVTLQNNTLQIRGTRSGRRRRELLGPYVSTKERISTFVRSISLPGAVAPDAIQGTLAHGLLRLEIPKVGQTSEPHRIPLQDPDQGEDAALDEVSLQDLHDPESGRLDARRIASYLDIPLKSLAAALRRKYSTVHKTPAAPSLQGDLRPIKRSLEILEDVMGDRSAVLAWWHTPHPDLNRRAPMDVLLEGYGGAIADMLESALAGTPS